MISVSNSLLALPPACRRFLRYCYYSIILSIVVIAITLQVARVLLSNIDNFRPSIESYLSETLSLNVTIGRLNGSWYGLRPHFLISSLQISDEKGRVLASLAEADVKLNLAKSLLAANWSWQHIVVSGLFVEVYQSENQRWYIANSPLLFTSSSTVNDHSEWLTSLFEHFPLVDVKQTKIQWLALHREPVVLDIPSIRLADHQQVQHLDASVAVDGKVVASLFVERTDRGNKTAFFSLDKFPLDRFMYTSHITVPPSLIDASLWLDSSSALTDWRVVGSIESEAVYPVLFTTNIKTELIGELNREMFSLGLRNTIVDGELSLSPITIESSDKIGESFQIVSEHIAINPLVNWMQKKLTASGAVDTRLHSLSPTGNLRHIKLNVDIKDRDRSTVSAYLDKVNVQPSDNIPGFSNINGFLYSHLMKGVINIDSQNLSFHPEKLYKNPIEFDAVRGQVAWHLQPEKNSLFINSNKIEGQSVYGNANGYFSLDIPLKPYSRPSEFTLSVGLTDGTEKTYLPLVPERVPESLRDWLSDSIQKANVSQAGFIYRGAFSGDDNSRSFQLFVDTEDAIVNYSPDWPQLESVRARVLLDNQYAKIEALQATLYDEPIDALSVHWKGDGRQEVDVNMSASLTAASGLRLLNESWLNTQVGDTFVDWKGTRKVSADVSLSIPIGNTNGAISEGSQSESRQTKVQANIRFNKNIFSTSINNLSLAATEGVLLYSSQSGLSSKNLRTQIFGHPLPLTLSQITTSDDSGEYLRIVGNGVADSEQLLSWLDVPNRKQFSGIVPYDLSLKIPTDRQQPSALALLSIQSTLEGFTSNLPVPFKKKSDDSYPFSLQGQIGKNSLAYQVSLRKPDLSEASGDQLLPIYASVKNISGALSGGVWINMPSLKNQLSNDTGFLVQANIPVVPLEPWLDVFSELPADGGDLPRINYDLNVGQIHYKSRTFKGLALSGKHTEQDEWRVNIKDDWVDGEISMVGSTSIPMNISLNYLSLDALLPKSPTVPAKEGVTSSSTPIVDPLSNIDFSVLKPATISIKKLQYKDLIVSDLQLALTPLENGLAINDWHADLGGLSLGGLSSDGDPGRGASLLWSTSAQGMNSRFNGVVSGNNIEQVFVNLQAPPLLKSQASRFVIDWRWQGSPAAFAVNQLNGTIGINMKQGVFFQNKSSASTGVLRLLGLFNFNTWARRLKFDFSDVYKKGVTFDQVTAQFLFNKGLIYFKNPLVVKSPSSEFTMAGVINYPEENMDTVLVTTLPVSGNLTVAAAFAAGLPAAIGVYIMSKIFKPQVDKVSSLTYAVKGSWNDPKVEFVNVFNNDLTIQESSPSSAPSENPPALDAELNAFQ